MKIIEGNIIDILNRRIYPGKIFVEGDIISRIEESDKFYDSYICPGFIDSHVHIESSMLLPEYFSDMVIQFGTISIIHDPHEIANVLGVEGVNFMVEHAEKSSIKIFSGIPSCVPATPFDSSGAIISCSDIDKLARSEKFIVLSEMMNSPGVVSGDKDVIKRLEIAKQYHLKIDGHAPLLSGNNLKIYCNYGINTDHECSTFDEAEEKIDAGMKIMIREGSAARNYEALKELISIFPENLLFCTDDAHPDDILHYGHINAIVKRAIQDGFDLFDVLRIACLNPIFHYNLPLGYISPGQPADFIRLDNIEDFQTSQVYINGQIRYDRKLPDDLPRVFIDYPYPNVFRKKEIQKEDLYYFPSKETIPIIEVSDGDLLTKKSYYHYPGKYLEADVTQDVLKIVYLNRYQDQKRPQISFIKGIGLKKGAYAATVSHDSHNIIAVGTNDSDITDIINSLIMNKGGLAVKDEEGIHLLPLPIAGILSDKNAQSVSREYQYLNSILKSHGCMLKSPFMTLSFMSLLVIPEIKIGEQGLFDYEKFDFIQ